MIQRESITSWTDTLCFISALGLLLAWLLCAALMWARSSLFTPYSDMCLVKLKAKFCTALIKP